MDECVCMAYLRSTWNHEGQWGEDRLAILCWEIFSPSNHVDVTSAQPPNYLRTDTDQVHPSLASFSGMQTRTGSMMAWKSAHQ